MLESSNNYDDDQLDSSIEHTSNSDSYNDKNLVRISTAPARPLTILEEFKRSNEFLLLEQTILCSSQLIQKSYQKYDLDSPEGQKICKKFLGLIEKLQEVNPYSYFIIYEYYFVAKSTFMVNTVQRNYRENFSKAYRILYQEGSLGYLIEILDSAQEAFPYLWVNGEKYIFSPGVLDSGQRLLCNFYKLQNLLRNSYSKLHQDNQNCDCEQIRKEIIQMLEEFDVNWTQFEEIYVTELMVIEKDARRFIFNAIELEKELMSIEIRQKMKGKILVNSEEYNQLRNNMCKVICQINSVANVEGKGRDDLEYQILVQAECLLRRISRQQSKAVRKLSENIRESFIKMRELFRKYEENVEMVDPQLKNNDDLVDALAFYESSWEKGREYFLDDTKCESLIACSNIIETLAEKYKEFDEMLECRDADVFLQIPCILILCNLDNDDKNICVQFLPNILQEEQEMQLIIDYKSWKNSQKNKGYLYYNVIEKLLLNIPLNTQEELSYKQQQLQLDKVVQRIRQLAIQMQRNNPTDWNTFLNVALLN